MNNLKKIEKSKLTNNSDRSPQFNIEDCKLPFVDSPFYRKLAKNHNNKLLKYSDKLNSDGYCIIDTKINEKIIDNINYDIDNALKKRAIKTNSNAYHYNLSPRIVEAWKFSEGVKNICSNKNILDVLSFSYQSEPIPFSTINFLKGTEQPLHSDEFHFGSIPHRYLSGCWIALEDIHEDSGPLSIAVGSHKLPVFSFEDIGLEIPKNEKDFKYSYTIYEEWVKEIIDSYKFDIVTPKLKKGQCLIWLSNTLHGAYEIKDKKLTRKSLVVHYHYDKCEMLFYPNYSNLLTGKLVPRSMQNLDIRS